MSSRLLPKEPPPKEPGMMRDTTGQDRVIEPSPWKRRRTLLMVMLAAVLGLTVPIVFLLRYSGAGASVDRSRLSIATVERGNFVRDVAADGQVVAAVNPTPSANALGTVTLKVHARDTVSKGQVLAVIDSPDLTPKLFPAEAAS